MENGTASVHLSKVNKVTVAALSNFLEGFKNKRPMEIRVDLDMKVISWLHYGE